MMDNDEYSNDKQWSGEPPSPSPSSRGRDDAVIEYGDIDCDNDVGNSFTQIQSRRFFPRGNDASKNNSGGGGGGDSRGSSLPCRWSLCPTMDLVAVGIGGSVIVDVDVDSSSSSTSYDDEPRTTRTGTMRLDAAESVAVHRIESWRTLMSVGVGALASRRPGHDEGEEDDDGGIVCLDDIERECGASSALAAIVEADDNDYDDEDGDDDVDDENHEENEDDKCGNRGPTTLVGDEGEVYNNGPNDIDRDNNDVYDNDGYTSKSVDSIQKDVDETTTGGMMNGATCLAWSPDGRRLAIGLLDGGVLVRAIEPHASSSSSAAASYSTTGEGTGGEVSDVDGYALSSSHVIRPPPPPRRGRSSGEWRSSTRTAKTTKNHGPQQVNAIDGRLGINRGGDIIPDDGGGRKCRADFSPRVTRSMTRGLGVIGKEQRRGLRAGEGSMGGGRLGGRSTAAGKRKTVFPAVEALTAPVVTSPSSPRFGAEGNNVASSRIPSLLLSSSPVIGMTWNRLRSSRRRWWRRQCCSMSLSKCSDDFREEDDEEVFNEHEAIESWRYASQLIDRGVGHFLPDPHRHVDGLDSTKTLGSFSSPRLGPLGGGALDVLCVATTKEIHWYLRGRYRILSVPHGLSLDSSSPLSTSRPKLESVLEEDVGGRGIDLVCSPDLGTLIAYVNSDVVGRHTKKQTAKLFCTALLPRKRFELQILSSSYASLFSRLWDVRKGICEALTSWRTTLRPLDAKFQGLLKLLYDHGVDGTSGLSDDRGYESIRLEFLKFILCGRSTISNASFPAALPSSSSSTSALDQFFTRAQMHDTLLHREMRMVESCASSTEVILRSHVLGSIRAIVYEAEELYGIAASVPSRGDSRLVDVKTALCLYRASRILYLTFDQCLHHVVEARIRLHDLLAWLRGTAARVRAWGTAPDSIQRRNARALRVSNGVVQRVAASLSCPMMFSSRDCDGSQRILTECIIGVPLSDFFVKVQQPRATLDSAEKENVAVCGTNRICNLTSAVLSMFQLCTILFDKPRRVFAKSVSMLGAGYCYASSRDASNGTRGFFLPKIQENDPGVEECSFWTVLARSLGMAIELIAIPGCSRFEQDTTFYLRAVMLMPEGHEVTNIQFYGDDGNSSLSPNLDEDSDIKEGRQSVGFLVQCKDPVSQEGRTELWLFRYDDILFQKCYFKTTVKNEVIIHGTAVDEGQCIHLIVSDEEVRDVSSAHVPKSELVV
ncbi:hypothetical protein ACHAXA_004654 [Cyclostephanos tholiformis]|uniref:Anaphase-promoting complex subunit 4 n=1 Tax=Cyclostephanos tholiformis TaxID=382380 RepID=A0ABD3R821_9STRA